MADHLAHLAHLTHLARKWSHSTQSFLSFIDCDGNSDGVEAATVKGPSIFESKPTSAASFRPGRPFPFTVYSAACVEMLSDDCAIRLGDSSFGLCSLSDADLIVFVVCYYQAYLVPILLYHAQSTY